MTDQELERRLAQALDHAAPNDLSDILSRCGPGKGTVTEMEEIRTTKKNHWRPLIAAVLALVILGGGGAGFFYQQANAVASVVSLDVNPSIELKVSKSEKVLACTPMNDDARTVLADMGNGADLKGTKLDVAVNAIVGSLLRNGYLDSISSAILISVEDDDQSRAARLQEELAAAVDSILVGANNTSSVYTQYMTTDQMPAVQTLQNTRNLSAGVANLVQRVLEMRGTPDDAEAEAALSELSVEELMDLLQTGETRIPIGMNAAALAAEEYAGTLAVNSVTNDVDPELEDVTPHYEVELHTSFGEFEYLVDAFTGEVFQGQKDILTSANPGTGAGTGTGTDTQSGTGTQTPAVGQPSGSDSTTVPDSQTGIAQDPSTGSTPAQNPSTGTDIGVEAAKAAALQNSGIASADATFIKAKLDYDNGRAEYDVEFTAGDWKYEYEIDASTGSILKSEKEPLPQTPNTGITGGTGSVGTGGNTGTAAGIGEDAALQTALQDFNNRWPELSGQDLTRQSCKYDRDDNHYEVEFWCNGEDFDCEIDAASGQILSWDTDYRTPTTGGAESGDIGVEGARQAALAHAGLTADQVTGLKVERDQDHHHGQSILEYEVEFRANGYEYEYKIDGATGAVLEHDMEHDD